jgi:hypothetical protein
MVSEILFFKKAYVEKLKKCGFSRSNVMPEAASLIASNCILIPFEIQIRLPILSNADSAEGDKMPERQHLYL